MSDARILVVDPDPQTRQSTADEVARRLPEIGSQIVTVTPLRDGRAALPDSFDDAETDVVGGSGGESRTSSGGGRLKSLSSATALTGIGINLPTTYVGLYNDGIERIRTGILSALTLLMYKIVRTVFRFLKTLSGQIAAIEGINVFFIDPTSHDTESTNMLTQVSDGRREVRESDEEAHGNELRVRGLPNQPGACQGFTLGGGGDR